MGVFTSLLLFCVVCVSTTVSHGQTEPELGVCYGELGDNLPIPTDSIKLIQKLNATLIKIYDANPKILEAVPGTSLRTMIMLPNDLIPNIADNQALADQWVQQNVVPYYAKSNIGYLLVGNEILSNPPQTTWLKLVPAMDKIQNSVQKFGLENLNVGTPLAMDMLESSYPPSNGTFRGDVRDTVIKPLLEFLDRTKSYFFADVYTYFAWVSNTKDINLDFALLKSTNISNTDPASGLVYTNLLDQMLDAIFFAMKNLGYPNVPLFIAETGWPSDGDPDQEGANLYNAATYNRNVVRKFATEPPKGTPSRPGVVIPAMIFALYNENQKPGKGTERHFGLLNPDQSPVYPIDLSGNTPDSGYPPLPDPKTGNKLWCVVGNGSNETALAEALSYACGQGDGICNAIQPGGSCYNPDTLINHASYAFSSYWAQKKAAGGSCYFNGLAVTTSKDPTYESCQFPSVDA